MLLGLPGGIEQPNVTLSGDKEAMGVGLLNQPLVGQVARIEDPKASRIEDRVECESKIGSIHDVDPSRSRSSKRLRNCQTSPPLFIWIIPVVWPSRCQAQDTSAAISSLGQQARISERKSHEDSAQCKAVLYSQTRHIHGIYA